MGHRGPTGNELFLTTRDVLYKQIVRLKRQGRPDAWKSTVNVGSGDQVPTGTEQTAKLVYLLQQPLAPVTFRFLLKDTHTGLERWS